jgi:predicted kinase
MPKGVILFTGMPGSGKSTSAKRINIDLGFNYVSNMQIRRELGHKRYLPGQNALVYEIMHNRIAESLENGLGVIVDSTNSRAEAREKIYSIAFRYSADVVLLETVASEEVAKRRISLRQKTPGVVMEPTDPAIYEKEKLEREDVSYEELIISPNVSYVIYDTEENVFTRLRVIPTSRDLVGRIEETLISGYYNAERRREATLAL